MADPFRHPKSGIYYLRRKVPDELRGPLGRLEFKRSLKTRDLSEAKLRFAKAWLDSEAAFHDARAMVSGAIRYTRADAEQLAGRWTRAEHERILRTGDLESHLFCQSSERDTGTGIEAVPCCHSLREELSEDPGWSPRPLAIEAMEAYLRDEGLPRPSSKSSDHAILADAFVSALLSLSDWAAERWNGSRETVPTGLVPLAPVSIRQTASDPAKQTRTLSALFVKYAETKKLDEGDTRGVRRTLAAYRSIVDGFVDLYGDLQVAEITRELANDYRGDLSRLPSRGIGIRGLGARELLAKADSEDLPRLTAPTTRNRLNALSAVMSVGVALHGASENPFAAGGVRRAAAKAATKQQRRTYRTKHYSDKELRAIFCSPAFTVSEWQPPRADFGTAWYWLPLLLYYTGARREEIAQLKVHEVSEIDGTFCISILAQPDEAGDERGVKTDGSRRYIPVHPDLITLGLRDYLDSLPAEGPMFPWLKANPQGYYGANFGKRWKIYLQEIVGLHSTASPIHGFRHTFRTLAREVGISEEFSDAITGHSGGGIGRSYGEVPLRRLATEIAKIPSALSRPWLRPPLDSRS